MMYYILIAWLAPDGIFARDSRKDRQGDQEGEGAGTRAE